MFDKFIRRPVLSIVISLIIVFLGILSLVKLPVTQFPSISPPKVNITAEYPGANNELLIKSVVIPLERSLNGVPGMKFGGIRRLVIPAAQAYGEQEAGTIPANSDLVFVIELVGIKK